MRQPLNGQAGGRTDGRTLVLGSLVCFARMGNTYANCMATTATNDGIIKRMGPLMNSRMKKTCSTMVMSGNVFIKTIDFELFKPRRNNAQFVSYKF